MTESITPARPSASCTLVATSPLTVSIASLGTSVLKFKFDTHVTDEALYQNGNTDKNDLGNLTFVNTATFAGTVIIGTVPTTATMSGTGTAKAPSNMVTKEGGGYNYASQAITWKITVNKNKIAMPNGATLTDILIKKGQKLSVASLANSITVTSAADGTIYRYNYDYKVEYEEKYIGTTLATGTLTINFLASSATVPGKSICDGNTVIVTIVTKVDVSNTDAFKDGSIENNNFVLKISNTATLKGSDYSNTPVSGTGSQQITNEMIGKNGADYDKNTNKIHYTIKVNPNELNLIGCTLVDELDSCLRLDVDSVKLYKAVSTDGRGNTFATTGLVHTGLPANQGYNWTYDNTTNTFTINLPNAASAYILEYDCIVVQYKAQVKNTVKLTGVGTWNEAQQSKTTNILANSYAITRLKEQSYNLSIYKVDSISKIPISGLNFQLTMSSNGNTIIDGGQTGNRKYVDTGVMNPDGKLTFYYLKPGWEYKLEELAADGENARVLAINGATLAGTDPLYLKNYVFIPSTSGNTDRTLLSPNSTYSIVFSSSANISLSISNDPVATIEFLKLRRGNNARLDGAKFRLAGRNLNGTAYIQDQNSKNGGVVKFTGVPITGTPGSIYTLTELYAPSNNYIKDTTVYYVKVNWNRSYTISIASVGGTVVYDSTNPASYGTTWTVKNTYSASTRKRKSSNSYPTTPITTTPINISPLRTPISFPIPFYTGNTIVPGDEPNVYIEHDRDGTPVGTWTWKQSGSGDWGWVFTPNRHNPSTGDTGTLFLWILCFYAATASLIAMIRKRRRL